jgi:hypothetical protein
VPEAPKPDAELHEAQPNFVGVEGSKLALARKPQSAVKMRPKVTMKMAFVA